MDGFPVVIRTLDPPLHEFLPKRKDLMVDVANPMPLVFPFEGRNRISHVPISVLGQGFALGELGTVSPDCPRARAPSAAVR